MIELSSWQIELLNNNIAAFGYQLRVEALHEYDFDLKQWTDKGRLFLYIDSTWKDQNRPYDYPTDLGYFTELENARNAVELHIQRMNKKDQR